MLCDANGVPLTFLLSGGQASDPNGIMLGFPAYQYTTPGARMFEAVATLPSGEVRATYLIDVKP
ncbi:hypothetical protein EMIT0P291_140059 [Pseudomonas sp. IT-P291]